MIEIKLTYNEVKALSLLGSQNAIDSLVGYENAESCLRNQTNNIGLVARFLISTKNDNIDFGVQQRHFQRIISAIDEIVENEDVKRYFFNTHSRTPLVNIKHRCEFLGQEEYLLWAKYHKLRPLYLTDIMDALQELWDAIELEFDEPNETK